MFQDNQNITSTTQETDFSFLNNIPLTTMGEKPQVVEKTGEITQQQTEEKSVPETKIETTQENNNQQENNTPTSETVKDEGHEIEVTQEDLGTFLNDETDGVIKSVSELHSIIETNQKLQERIKELETNPIGVFKDPNQAAIAKFLMDYKGGDYQNGIQTYARLQQLDIPNMKAEDALREAYILDKSQAGISRADAEEMFKYEFDRKYNELGDVAEKFINADAYEARKKLEASKEAYSVEPKKDDNPEGQQREAEFKEARAQYEESVNKSMDGFKSIIIEGLTDNPEHNFTFEVENVQEITKALDNYDNFFFERYVTDKGANVELMKQDIAMILNKEKMYDMLFNHGKVIGKEEAIMERQNIQKKTDPPASNLAGNGTVPQSLEQALLGAKIVR